MPVLEIKRDVNVKMQELSLTNGQPPNKKIKRDTIKDDHEELMDVDNDRFRIKRKYHDDECAMTDQKMAKIPAPTIPPSILRAMPELYNYM